MKEAYYFSHDANARMDDKILELRSEFGWHGYGLYWAIVETLRDCSDYTFPSNATAGLALSLNIAKTELEQFIKKCIDLRLFVEEDGVFFSESLMKRMEQIDEKRRKRAEAGRLGGKAKANAKQSSGNAKAKASKEKKEKESKEKESKEKGKEGLPAPPSDPKGAHLFKDSPFVNLDLFKQQFTADKFKDVDLDYYYDSMLDWSDSKGAKKLDWIATARGFIRRDEAENKVKKKASNNSHNFGNNPRNLSMAGMI